MAYGAARESNVDEHNKADIHMIGARLKADFSLQQQELPRDMEALLALLRFKEAVPTKPVRVKEPV
jgi:hypothetical protein